MEILSERVGERERNALNIVNPQQVYTVKLDCEPVLRFVWNFEEKYWQYSPGQHFAFAYEILEPNEILIKVTLDDNARTIHRPYVNDLSNPSLVYKLEHAMNELAKLPPPRCAEKMITDKKKKKKKSK